ncbi:DUF4277 domain-containing protein [Candidatus Rhabdochlamydia oedothoracis]|uniref:DUF4277 domain-containing protein n=1 Tax=Candidatus Rhabdochlamydia oedothoracis TaxID=2720720 RepID=UPI001BFC711A
MLCHSLNFSAALFLAPCKADFEKFLNTFQTRIDNRLPSGPQRKVSPGIAAVAMIINGLGFTNRTLYLAHQY